MGRLVVEQFTTLDGVVQSPGAPDEDPSGGFTHGGWQLPYFADDIDAIMAKELQSTDALLIGRKTYDIFAAYWPTATAEEPFTSKLNKMPKYVASRTLRNADWNNSTLLGSDTPAEIRQVKGRHDVVRVFGSADLVQTLFQHQLIDHLSLWIYPLVLGAGKRLFPQGITPATFDQKGTRTFDNGAIRVEYSVVDPGGTHARPGPR